MKSNKFILVAVAALIPAAAAFAQSSVADAYRNGYIASGEVGVPMRSEPVPTSGISRAQVQGELRTAQASNMIISGETIMGVDTTPMASTRSRAEVQSEAVQAVRNGEIVAGEAGTSPVGHSQPDTTFARGATKSAPAGY